MTALADERQRERQEECCEEIRSLRCEIEMMKTAMDEMRRHMNEMQMQLQNDNSRVRSSSRSDDDNCSRSIHVNLHHDTCASNFSEWINGLEVTPQDLEAMFDSKDVVEWACKIIVTDLNKRSVHPHPLCAVNGSKNELLVYDKDVWKKLTDKDFVSIIANKMFKKILLVFTAWKNENYNRILSSEHFSTLYHLNYARILSFNENASKLKTKLFHAL